MKEKNLMTSKKHGKLITMHGLKQRMMLKRRLHLKRLKFQKKHTKMPLLLLLLVLVVVQLPSSWLVSSLFLLPLLVVVSGTRTSKVKLTKKVVKLMTESFTRAKSPQLTLTRKHKRLLSLMLMYENYQDELNFEFINQLFIFLFLFLLFIHLTREFFLSHSNDLPKLKGMPITYSLAERFCL